MIAFVENSPSSTVAGWHLGFLELLPRIQRHACLAFRRLGPEEREEAVSDVIANALCAYRRLVKLGKQNLAYPYPLARFAVAHYWAGRRVGSSMHSNDVFCSRAQRQGGFQMERFDAGHVDREDWEEALADNTSSPVPDQAAFRIDFPEWLAAQSPRDRRLAKFLALGNGPAEAADRFRVSRARVSQIRRELRQSWAAFQGELPPTGC
jgi:hypothetical protein